MSQDAILLIGFSMKALLAAVLVAAGAAKLADIQSFVTTLIGLGVPIHKAYLVKGLALAVPLVEMGLGIMLVSGLWPVIINAAVLLLMSCFSIVVLVALSKASHVTCRCFGALTDSQFSGKGLIRSLFLTVLATLIFWEGKVYASQFNWSSGIVILLIVGYLIFAVAVAQAARVIAEVKERVSL